MLVLITVKNPDSRNQELLHTAHRRAEHQPRRCSAICAAMAGTALSSEQPFSATCLLCGHAKTTMTKIGRVYGRSQNSGWVPGFFTVEKLGYWRLSAWVGTSSSRPRAQLGIDFPRNNCKNTIVSVIFLES